MRAFVHLINYAFERNCTVVIEGEVMSSPDDAVAFVEGVDETAITIKKKIALEGGNIGAASLPRFLDKRVGTAYVSAYGLSDEETVIDHSDNLWFTDWELSYDDYQEWERMENEA